MRFQRLLERADEVTLQEIIGPETVGLLHRLRPELVMPSRLRELVESRHPAAALLRNRECRSRLLELLPEGEARELCRALDLDVSHPYETLASVRITRHSRREGSLFAHFGVPAPDESAGDNDVEERTTAEPGYGLYSHQARVAERALAALNKPPHRALIHMPTGSGKTRTTMHVIAEYLRRHPDGLIVWLAHSEELCGQAADEFATAWSYLGHRPVPVYRFWGSAGLEPHELEVGFMVAGLAKLDALASRDPGAIGALGARTVLVVLDEGHKGLAPTYQTLLEALRGVREDAALLGLTATPGRSWNDIAADEALAALYNRTRIPLEIPGYSNPVEYLIDQGFLARPRFASLFGSDNAPTDSDRRKIEASLDIPSSVLERLAADELRNLGIVERVLDLTSRHERIMVFAATVAHCHILAAVLTALEVEAHAVTSQTAPSERDYALHRYQRGPNHPVVLINYGVLTMGFDAPRTSSALIARPTTSLVLYSQMIGRAMRGPRAGGNAECEIVTVVDRGLPGFRDMAEAFNHWNDAWGDDDGDATAS